WVPLLAGVAVCRALADAAGVDARLKWPNDVLVGDRKICGILAEVAAGQVVLGVGLNVSTRADELPPDRPSTSVALAGGVTDRLTLLRALLRCLAGDTTGDDYRELCATLGREVSVQLPDDTVATGTATAIDDDGRLVVTDAAGAATAYAAGDVVHLR
ncbi:MAG: biotin--[acetyl-CoA-carboxylase] ligase, partial [Mycobacteriales bacterium]